MFTEKYISNLSTDFVRRTQDNGKINFGLRRTERIDALLHWVKYLYLISGDPTIIDLNEVVIIHQLDTALYRAETRKKIIYQSNTKAKEDSPGPL